jgi:glycosyltransferase involved in cell wall biosynthesis
VRIGMNLIPLRPGGMGGAEMYLRDLLAELTRAPDHDYVLATATWNHATLPADSPRCRRVLAAGEGSPAAGALRRLRHAARPLARVLAPWRRRRRHAAGNGLRALIEREAIDLWFCPFSNLDPRPLPVPAVIFIHDLQHEHHPEFFAPDELRHRRTFYPASCTAADHIITNSEFTRQSVIEAYGVDAARISAIWIAPGSDFVWQDAGRRVREVRARYRLPDRYAFYPANTWPHKNHARLVEALARYRQRHGADLGLVLTGAREGGQPALEAVVARAGLADAVRLLGYVPRGDLPALYAGAACLVYPSLFEGFGIPVPEAMLVGCPVIASRATSLPEVVGDAGLLFDPLDPDDIARALAAVARDPATAAELSRRGRERARLFTAEAMARRTLEVFELARHHRGTGCGEEPLAVEVDGVFGDRWVGEAAVLWVRGASLATLEVHGELPASLPITRQRLEVSGPSRAPLVTSLDRPGPFVVTVPLADGHTGWREIGLRPARTFRPADHGLGPDRRRLSLQLSLVRVRTREGRELVKHLGSA